MANKFFKGEYILQHPEKYSGSRPPIYRSSWEYGVMRLFDNNPAIISWASESVIVRYMDPLTGHKKNYIPDFLVVYQDKSGQTHAELVEVKPSKEAVLTEAKSTRDRALVARNHAKWHAANAFCKRNGMSFRVLTESQIFGQGKKR